MRRGLLTAMLALGLLATSATALAGLKTNAPVVVNSLARFAFGSLGSARNTGDGSQFIGCTVTDSTGSPFVTCSARAPGGAFATCTSSDPGKVMAATAINDDSHVFFRYDTTGACTYLSVSTFSYYTPKVP